MAFRASNARILVTDASDTRVVLDSDEGLFSATDFVSGQVTTPQRVATYNGNNGNETFVDIDIDHPLASVNPAADVVVGGFKVTTSSPVGLAGLGWFQGNGTYVHYMWAEGSPVGGQSENNWWQRSIAAYTFRCSGGLLVLNERVVLRAQSTTSSLTITHTLLPVTFDYKLFCGRFV